MTKEINLGGSFTLADNSLTVNRMSLWRDATGRSGGTSARPERGHQGPAKGR